MFSGFFLRELRERRPMLCAEVEALHQTPTLDGDQALESQTSQRATCTCLLVDVGDQSMSPFGSVPWKVYFQNSLLL